MDLSSLKQVVCEQTGVDWNSLYFAVPDIHGSSKIANQVVAILESIQAQKVVFLGDLVDRNTDPFGVVRAVFDGKARNPSWEILSGNHELMSLQQYLTGENFLQENSIFNLCTEEEIEICIKLFSALPAFHEAEHLLFIHGGIWQSFEMNIRDVPIEELTWTYGVHPKYQGKKIVRGHEVYSNPTEEHNNIATQTLAWASDEIPFCISVIRNTSDEKKLMGWIEIHLGSNELNFISQSQMINEILRA